MWSLYWVILIVLVLFALYQIAVSRAVQMADEMIGAAPEDEIPKLVQIRNLKEAGITFRTEALEQEVIFDHSGNEYYAAHPYYALLTDAGARGILANVYGIIDRECIYDDEYGKILKGLADISGLDITHITCPGRHTVSWQLKGRTFYWRGKRQRDWADHRIGTALNRFCKGEQRIFTDNSHLGIIFFYGTVAQAENLNREFGLRFR